MTTRADGWRTLTAEELAAEPAARFGGTIAAIFCVAVLLLIPLPLMIFVSGGLVLGLIANIFTLLHDLFSTDIKSAATAYALLQMLAFTAWAAVFVVAVIFRWRAGAMLAVLLFAFCLLLGPFNSIVRLVAVTGLADSAVAVVSEAPRLLLSLVAVLAFWAYLREGRRPNLYFGRRVRV